MRKEEGKLLLLRKVSNKLPDYTVQHPRKTSIFIIYTSVIKRPHDQSRLDMTGGS